MKIKVIRIIQITCMIGILACMSLRLGIPCRFVDVSKGAFWPDLGFGNCKIYIWQWGKIIYNDDFHWIPATYDSLLKEHLKSAEKYKP